MRPYFPVATPLRRVIRAAVTLGALLLALASHELRAQVGNNNPTGVAGIWNGNVLEYDPYTGNAGPRSTTDISIAGAVVPLALVRTYNSRDGSGIHFGSNGWRHSYEWTIDPSGNLPSQTMLPAAYVVNFPDGRRETFQFVSWDCGGNPYRCYYRVWGAQGGVDSSAGVRERFAQIDPLNNNFLGYLILSDGSKVEFLATRHPGTQNNTWYYTYQAQGVIDPYGQRTSFSYDGVGRLYRVTELALRYIQFNYRSNTSQVIGSVSGSDGRTVQYNYISSAYPPGTTQYLELDNVVFYGQSQWTAKYKYRGPNDANNANGIPLLWTADEPLYAQTMKRISYEYKTGTNQDGSQVPYGQIYKVRYWDGTTQNAGNGVPVSTLAVTGKYTRVETRGDNKTRTFNYGTGNPHPEGYLVSYTDFTTPSHSASQTYDSKNYINSVTDRNGHRTDYTLDPVTGNITQAQFPAIAMPSPAPRGIVNYTYTNNYYLHTVQDEGTHTTTINRYGDNRIQNIVYPDGGWESFTYDNNSFGLIHEHRVTTGATETFTYDGRGLTQTHQDSTNLSGNPNARYGYDVYDRVSDVTDVFGGYLGDADHTTSFAYNSRGQLLTTTLPKDPVDHLRHAIINAYNPNGDGTVVSRTDALSHVSSYTYRRLPAAEKCDYARSQRWHRLAHNFFLLRRERNRRRLPVRRFQCHVGRSPQR